MPFVVNEALEEKFGDEGEEEGDEGVFWVCLGSSTLLIDPDDPALRIIFVVLKNN